MRSDKLLILIFLLFLAILTGLTLVPVVKGNFPQLMANLVGLVISVIGAIGGGFLIDVGATLGARATKFRQQSIPGGITLGLFIPAILSFEGICFVIESAGLPSLETNGTPFMLFVVCWVLFCLPAAGMFESIVKRKLGQP